MSGSIFAKNRLRFRGSPYTASKKFPAIKSARDRRYVMEGYPIETKFTSPEEGWEYLKADRITCLRCGKAYKALAPAHLSMHGWTADRYKEHYGLPWRTGLTCTMTKDSHRRQGLANLEAGVAFGGKVSGEYLDKAHAAPRRKRAPYLKTVSVMNVSTAPSMNRARVLAGELRLWKDADYWNVLDRMKDQDRTAREVCGDPDMPGLTALAVFSRNHPEYSQAMAATWEHLSFPVQARGQQLGRRFKREAARLRKKGRTSKQIGKELGVHWVTVEKHILGVPCPEKMHCPAGHPYPVGGRKRCNICNTEMTRRRKGYLPRAEAARTLIKVSCSFCGAPLVRSWLCGRRRKVRCDDCARDYQREYHLARRKPRRAEHGARG